MTPQNGEDVEIRAEYSDKLPGNLVVPADAKGVVLFAHGSGSGRFSPRNRYVAERLNEVGLATLLIDLLTESEAHDRSKVFDIDLLGLRVLYAASWLKKHPPTRGLPVGVFGASTGGGAALAAASVMPELISCVVSRGGRPDLAGEALPGVLCPTLLIVGGNDSEVLALNEAAQERMTAPCELAVVPGATHLFEEPGTLEQVADLAAAWFLRHLCPGQES
jgi:putative phosphoribosyl transferase